MKKKHGKEFVKGGKEDDHGLDRTRALELATGRHKKKSKGGGKKSRRGAGRY